MLFHDYQDAANPNNGASIDLQDAFKVMRSSLTTRPPFMCALSSTMGVALIGVAADGGCVQFSPSEEGPYAMLLGDRATSGDGERSFLVGGTPTPIPERYMMSWPRLSDVASHLLLHGLANAPFPWEAV